MMSSSDDACGQGGASVINWTETTGGDYYLKVRGFNTGSSGSYILSYSYGAAPVATCQSLPLFDYDITIPPVAGTWAATPLRTIIGGACDIYRVTLTAGLTYTFATGCGNDVATSNFDTYLELFSSLPGYPSVISDDDACGPGGASVINWTATGDGVYFLKVRGYNGSSAGGYVLSYSYGVVPPVTCPTLPAYTNEGVNTDYELTPTTVCTATPLRTITGGSCHIYKLTLTHDRVYTFETGCGCGEGSSNFDTFLELFDGTAPYVLISSNDDACGPGGASLLTWTATGDGVFYLKVRGYNSSSAGNYKLSAKYTGGKMTEDLEGNQSYDNLVKVYPNPARQLFTIMSDQPLTFDQVILTGFAGQQVRTWTLDQPTSNYQIDGSEFNPGVYIISLRTSDGWVRKKLSIIR
jgi:hypothetical protein